MSTVRSKCEYLLRMSSQCRCCTSDNTHLNLAHRYRSKQVKYHFIATVSCLFATKLISNSYEYYVN